MNISKDFYQLIDFWRGNNKSLSVNYSKIMLKYLSFIIFKHWLHVENVVLDK